MEEALKLINQPVAFRHNGHDSIGVIKGIAEARNKTIIAVIQLEKSKKKTGIFSKFWNTITGDDDRIRIPINFLHILTDVKPAQRNTRNDAFTDFIKPSTDIPTILRFQGSEYETTKSKFTLKFQCGDGIDRSLELGCDVFWNKSSNQETNPIGTVAYFAYRIDLLLKKSTVRVCVDFVDQQIPARDFNDYFIARVCCKDKGILFRYCIPYEELIELEEYLMKFQMPPGPEQAMRDNVIKNLNHCQGTAEGLAKESTMGPKVNGQSNYRHSTKDKTYDNEWKIVTYGDKRRGNAHTTENSRYGENYYEYQRKTFFATCCVENKCDLKHDSITTACTVVYRRQEDPEPIIGEILWVGNAGIKNYPYLQGEVYAEIRFGSSVGFSGRFKVIHTVYCSSRDCKENDRLLISVDDLKYENMFNILRTSEQNGQDEEQNEEDEEQNDEKMPEVSNEDFTEIPPPCQFHSTAAVRLEYSERWGFQGWNNSCYADTTLFALFAFTDVFDSIVKVNHKLKDEASAADSNEELILMNTVHVLKQLIIGPLRKDFYVPKENIFRLRREMSKVNPEFEKNHMDVEDFMLCLFETILGVPGFFRYDKDYSDYIHQIMLSQYEEKPTFKEVNLLQQMVNESFNTSQVQLEDVPHPGFVIKLPVCGGKLMNCKYILPELKLDLGHILKRPDRGRTSMDLFSVICLKDSHFTCFVKAGNNWCFYDSNPTKMSPKVVHVPDLTDFLEDLKMKISQHNEFKLERYLKSRNEFAQHLMSTAYICIYI